MTKFFQKAQESFQIMKSQWKFSNNKPILFLLYYSIHNFRVQYQLACIAASNPDYNTSTENQRGTIWELIYLHSFTGSRNMILQMQLRKPKSSMSV